MANEKLPVDSGIGVLEIKLGACLSAPTKRMVDDLHYIANECNRARNAMVRRWERWREDEPDWKPEQRRGKKGELLFSKKDGKPVLEDPFCSQEMQKQIYHHGRDVAPLVYSNIISTCRQEVLKRLKYNLPSTHSTNRKERYKKRWQGLLDHEVSRDCYRGIVIPAPRSDSYLCYRGEISGVIEAKNSKLRDRILEAGKSSAVIRFPLFSHEADRKNIDVICRIEVRQLSPGNRHVIWRIATKQWELRDSKLVYKDGKGWFFQLTYYQPRRNLGLDPQRIATLEVQNGKSSHPLIIRTEGYDRPYNLGNAKMLLATYERKDRRRRAMRSRYSVAGTGVKGHGRGRFYRDGKPISSKIKNLVNAFAKQLISDIVNFCAMHNYGKVVYKDWSPQARASSWFAINGIDFPWSKFEPALKAKCESVFIEYENARTEKTKGKGRRKMATV